MPSKNLFAGVATGTVLYVVFFEIIPKGKVVGGTGKQHIAAMILGFAIFLPSLYFRKRIILVLLSVNFYLNIFRWRPSPWWTWKFDNYNKITYIGITSLNHLFCLRLYFSIFLMNLCICLKRPSLHLNGKWQN